MKILSIIFNSCKIHLTHSQKNFIEETYEILAIFNKDIGKIIRKEFENSLIYSNDKFKNGEVFFRKIYRLRYPITYKKLEQLKKFKIFSLEVNLNKENFHTEKELCEIKNILTTI